MNRGVPLAMVAVLAGGVVADPAADDGTAPVDPVAIAGRYKARLTWSSCTADGARQADLELRPVDSRLELDLAAVRAGMPVVVVAGDGTRLAGTEADVTVSLTWGKRGAIAVAIDLDSGCRVRGTARRDDTGIAACDALAALARIEAGCSAVAIADRREDVAGLDAGHADWARARGKRRRDLSGACQLRVDAIRPALVDAACLAVPDDEAPILIPACRDLAARIARLAACRSLPDDLRSELPGMEGAVHVQVEGAAREQSDMAAAMCSRQDEVLQQVARRFGCS